MQARQGTTRILAPLTDAYAVNNTVRTSKVYVLKYAARRLGRGLTGNSAQTVLVDKYGFARLYVADKLRAYAVQCARLARNNVRRTALAYAERTETVRVAYRNQLARAHYNQRIRTVQLRNNLLHRFLNRTRVHARLSNEVGYDFAVHRRVEDKSLALHFAANLVVVDKIASWMRTAVGIVESSHIRVMRVADNMRNVAVTEGDKVEAQIKFGWEVDAYPVNEIAESVAAVSQSDTNALVDEYYDKYEILLEGRDPEEFKKHVAVQAQIELGFERFLQEKNYQAIVTHFGDLGALKQLPGLAIQRLMEKGYGFGAEGDWKVAAMVRLMKVMTAGMKDAKGTSMLEDYTYNLVKGKEGILEAHMLEICPSIADGPISIKCQPLSMGDREDPARLVFTSKEGHGIATSLIDLGNRFRLIINDVECKKTEKPMPKLPTATNFWTPEPDIYTGAEAWILAGGAHHTAFTYDLTAEQMGDWAAAMGIEAVYIDKDTRIRDFKRDLMLGEVFYR